MAASRMRAEATRARDRAAAVFAGACGRLGYTPLAGDGGGGVGGAGGGATGSEEAAAPAEPGEPAGPPAESAVRRAGADGGTGGSGGRAAAAAMAGQATRSAATRSPTGRIRTRSATPWSTGPPPGSSAKGVGCGSCGSTTSPRTCGFRRTPTSPRAWPAAMPCGSVATSRPSTATGTGRTVTHSGTAQRTAWRWAAFTPTGRRRAQQRRRTGGLPGHASQQDDLVRLGVRRQALLRLRDVLRRERPRRRARADVSTVRRRSVRGGCNRSRSRRRHAGESRSRSPCRCSSGCRRPSSGKGPPARTRSTRPARTSAPSAQRHSPTTAWSVPPIQDQ